MAELDGWVGRAAFALVVVGACGEGGAATESDSGVSTTGSSGGTSGETSTIGTSTTTSETTSPSDSSGPSTGESSTSGGPAEYCGGWQLEGPTTPWLSLYDTDHVALASGGVLSLVCGGQGSWMFPIYPEMGGWELAGPSVTFAVTIDVEGWNDTPSGHFFDVHDLYYDLVCHVNGDELDGGFLHACLAVLPPDTITDLSALDGAATRIHVELDAPDGPVVIDLTDMTISAPAETVMQGCIF
jgi:hypothetical protein